MSSYIFPGAVLLATLGFNLLPVHVSSAPSATITPQQELWTLEGQSEAVVLPQSVPDPIEPLNRVLWSFNSGIMTGLVKPTAKAYRFIIVKPVRTSIGNFGRNITYP